MQRCIALAELGRGQVEPNPMVGAVLVHHDRIIGEGYHQQFGLAHAEVNCINSVAAEDLALISSSTLYVSLEPCSHTGKTPPCADLIIARQIPRVVIGCRDRFEAVNGKGIARLRAAGVEVIEGVLEQEALDLNIRFFSFHRLHRPYILLKWAQSIDEKIAGKGKERIAISNAYTNIKVHQWRAQESAIMVGTQTAATDDPALTVRHWPGNNPVRIVIDLEGKLPATLQLFDHQVRTIVFGKKMAENSPMLEYYQIQPGSDALQQIMQVLFQLQIQSVMVEGGARLLQSFIDAGLWDEARVITNTSLQLGEGLSAPILRNQRLTDTQYLMNDVIHFYQPIS